MNGVPRPNPWLTHTVRIRDIQHELDDVATYDLEFVDPEHAASYDFLPGQFNMLYLPGAGEIAISICDAPRDAAGPEREGRLAHTIRVAGNVTKTLSRLSVGDTIGLRGPYGVGWPLEKCPGQDVVVVAGGIGLAPLRPLILSLLHDRESYGNLHLLYGARTPETILYADQFSGWIERGFAIHTTVDRPLPAKEPWQGNVGVVTLLLERLPLDPANTIVICCGPEVMMKYTAITSMQRGIPDSRIWVSMERNMQCAVGFCGHCQLGPDFVCKDGPVFRYDRMARFMHVEAL